MTAPAGTIGDLYDAIGHDLLGPDGTRFRWVPDRRRPWGGCWTGDRWRRLANDEQFRKAGHDPSLLRIAESNSTDPTPHPRSRGFIGIDVDADLWDADPDCTHEVHHAAGGGILCVLCDGWCCL